MRDGSLMYGVGKEFSRSRKSQEKRIFVIDGLQISRVAWDWTKARIKSRKTLTVQHKNINAEEYPQIEQMSKELTQVVERNITISCIGIWPHCLWRIENFRELQCIWWELVVLYQNMLGSIFKMCNRCNLCVHALCSWEFWLRPGTMRWCFRQMSPPLEL